MTSAVIFGTRPQNACVSQLAADRGLFDISGLSIAARQSLPTDPIGTCTRTFDGVPAGSEIRIYRADGVELAGVESCASDNPSLSWSVYAPGANAVNRIVIIHLGYEIKEFNYTPAVGSGSLPVQMGDDDWYSNPA